MKPDAPARLNPTCLVYCPLPYNGRGPSRSCVQIVEAFHTDFARSPIYVPKSRSVPRTVSVVNGFPDPLNRLPWRLIKHAALARTEHHFQEALARADPSRTAAYFWPAPAEKLIDAARRGGFLSVREMTNCGLRVAKDLLDKAFSSAGLEVAHSISERSVDEERTELSKYDYVFSSNQEVDGSLLTAGVDPSRILKTSFGWKAERFNKLRDVEKASTFTAVFVGTIGIRKGALQLLQAWTRAKLPGELLMVGQIEPHFAPVAARYGAENSVRFLPFTDDIEKLYKSSHVFVFPTFEEGGPQVTYEAAGCGLPTITTPMGAGRIIEHGRNGLIIRSGDVAALAAALTEMFEDGALRENMAARARQDALRFTYDIVGRERARLLRGALAHRFGAE